jgi:general secretion pathway protein D
MRCIATIALFVFLAACAQDTTYREGLSLIEAGNVEAGLAKLEEAARQDPGSREYRQALFRQREIATQRYLAAAEIARQQGDLDAAEKLYSRMLGIDPQQARAKAGLAAVRIDRRNRAQLAEAEELLQKGATAAAAEKARAVLAENASNREAQQLLRRIDERAMRAAAVHPQLAAALRQPILLEFRDASLRQIFEAISRSSGLNFIFDREVRQDVRTTIFVRNSSVEDVLRFVLVTNQLERKVLSENTVLVYPNTAAKLRDYQELVTKSFFLTNADAKSIGNMLRTMVKTKDMYIDEKLNLVVIRDSLDAVRMAERLVANQDLAEPEVMLEVEILEVASNRLQNLGIAWPDSVSFSLAGAAGVPGSITLREWQNRDSDLVRIRVSDPFLALNFRSTLDRSNLLANPRIRVKNRDKAKVHIGDKVPVITTTSTSTGFASESVTYLDIGLKLEVEPAVSLDDEVAIKVGLEVSNIAREIRSTSGTLTYQVGTRNASTTLRLKDGETQILAGLISDEDRKSANQIPGLGDLPVVGRLFGSHQDTRNKNEIVLLITPRVLRNVARPEARLEEFLSGTEAAIGAQPLLLQRTAFETAPVAAAAPAPAAATPTSKASRVLLAAPRNLPVGEEFSLQVLLETDAAVRGGMLDFVFDSSRLRFVRASPGALLAAADKDASFRANAPEALGRLEVTFASKADLKGHGELAQLRFQVLGSAAGTPSIRLEAMSMTGDSGQPVSAPLPPPLSLTLTR